MISVNGESGFFTENQSGVNPHKSLSYEQSAQVIISHITDGLKLAEKHNLPKVIKDFISTHHGRGLTKYFYISYKNEHPDEEVDQEKFRYPVEPVHQRTGRPDDGRLCRSGFTQPTGVHGRKHQHTGR